MRKLQVLFVILSLALTAACGDSKKSSGGGISNNLMSPSTVSGYINTNTHVITVGGASYYPSQGQQINQPYGYQSSGQQNIIDPQSHSYLNQLYSQLMYNPSAYRQRSQGVYNIRFPAAVQRYGNQRSLVIAGPIQPY